MQCDQDKASCRQVCHAGRLWCVIFACDLDRTSCTASAMQGVQWAGVDSATASNPTEQARRPVQARPQRFLASRCSEWPIRHLKSPNSPCAVISVESPSLRTRGAVSDERTQVKAEPEPRQVRSADRSGLLGHGSGQKAIFYEDAISRAGNGRRSPTHWGRGLTFPTRAHHSYARPTDATSA